MVLHLYLFEQCLNLVFGTPIKTCNFVTFYKFLSHLGVHHTSWPKFNMHPLKINMRLEQAAHVQSHGGLISQEDEERLQYDNMLIDSSHNRNSDAYHVLQEKYYAQ